MKEREKERNSTQIMKWKLTYNLWLVKITISDFKSDVFEYYITSKYLVCFVRSNLIFYSLFINFHCFLS